MQWETVIHGRKDMLVTVSSTRSNIISLILSVSVKFKTKQIRDSHNLSQLTLSKLKEHLVDCRYYAISQNDEDFIFKSSILSF